VRIVKRINRQNMKAYDFRFVPCRKL